MAKLSVCSVGDERAALDAARLDVPRGDGKGRAVPQGRGADERGGEPSSPPPCAPSEGYDDSGSASASPRSSSPLPRPAPSAPALRRSRWREFLLFLGPGFMVCVSYIDPGNLSADVNQGAGSGYRLAWVTLLCTVLGWATQVVSARLSLSSDKDLAMHARWEHPAAPRYLLWFISELGVVACDMIEVIGGAVAIRGLSDDAVPLWGGALITAAAGFLLLLIERLHMRALEAALAVMTGLLGGAFVYLFFGTGVRHGQAFLGLVWPRLSSSDLQAAIGAVGAIITPHNLYLHSSLVLGRRTASAESLARRPSAMRRAVCYVALESFLALFVALIINFCVISVAAAEMRGSGGSILEVHARLSASVGAVVGKLWSVGLLAAAFASTVTSTYAGQVIVQGYFGKPIEAWWLATVVRLSTLGPTLVVCVALRSPTRSSFEHLTNWLNIVQSLVLPFVLVILARCTCSPSVLGRFAFSPRAAAFVFAVVFALVGLNLYLFVAMVRGALLGRPWAEALFALAMAAYCGFLGYLALGPRRCSWGWRALRNLFRAAVDPSLAPLEPGPVERWAAPDLRDPDRRPATGSREADEEAGDASEWSGAERGEGGLEGEDDEASGKAPRGRERGLASGGETPRGRERGLASGGETPRGRERGLASGGKAPREVELAPGTWGPSSSKRGSEEG